VKVTGQHQVVVNKKHFEGLRTAGPHPVPQPMPKQVRQPAPEVMERDLSIYEHFLNEAVTLQ